MSMSMVMALSPLQTSLPHLQSITLPRIVPDVPNTLHVQLGVL